MPFSMPSAAASTSLARSPEAQRYFCCWRFLRSSCGRANNEGVGGGPQCNATSVRRRDKCADMPVGSHPPRQLAIRQSFTVECIKGR